jgi:uncharacterized membrane protein YoaK (UPF0700 family)
MSMRIRLSLGAMLSFAIGCIGGAVYGAAYGDGIAVLGFGIIMVAVYTSVVVSRRVRRRRT